MPMVAMTAAPQTTGFRPVRSEMRAAGTAATIVPTRPMPSARHPQDGTLVAVGDREDALDVKQADVDERPRAHEEEQPHQRHAHERALPKDVQVPGLAARPRATSVPPRLARRTIVDEEEGQDGQRELDGAHLKSASPHSSKAGADDGHDREAADQTHRAHDADEAAGDAHLWLRDQVRHEAPGRGPGPRWS